MQTAYDHFHIVVDDACKPGGSGQCDGSITSDHDENSYAFAGECYCPCHGHWDLPTTVAGVKVWHDNFWGLTKEN